MELGIADILMIFLVTIGPIKAGIVFASLTAGTDSSFRRSVAIKTVVTATAVCLLFVLAGGFLLTAFHVSIPALKIAGGLILMLYALSMVKGEDSSGGEQTDTAPSTNIAIYPLAMPLLATPQGIVLITTITATTTSIREVMSIVVLILAVMAFNFVFLLGAHWIIRVIGRSALQVVASVVGLLFVALAVQLMMWGLVDLGFLEPTV
jgi:multiple antibiotic resistance protein